MAEDAAVDWSLLTAQGMLITSIAGVGASLLRLALECMHSPHSCLKGPGRVFVLVPEDDPRVTVTDLLRSDVLRPLCGSDPPERLAEFLSPRMELVKSAGLAGPNLGMQPDTAARVSEQVRVVVHSWAAGDYCRDRPRPAEIAEAGFGTASFAARCGAVLVLPVPAASVAASARFRGQSRDTVVPEAPTTPTFDAEKVCARLTRSGRDADTAWLEQEAQMPAAAAAGAAVAAVLSQRACAEGQTGFRLRLVRHGLIGPPLRGPAPPAAMQGDDGGLVSLAFAVGVGATDFIPGDPMTALEVVPADTLAAALLLSPAVSPHSPLHVIHACTTAVHPLSLGVFADHVSNYWVRNHSTLAAVLDNSMTASGQPAASSRRLSPLLARPAALDVGERTMKSGLRTAARRKLRRWSAAASHIARHPHAEVSARLRDAMEVSGRSVDRMIRAGGYTSFALRLGADTMQAAADHAAQHGCTVLPLDLRLPEWEGYCKSIARDAFVALCRVLRVTATSPPPPARYCDMDGLVAAGGGSEFSPPAGVHRRLMPDLHFLRVVNRLDTGLPIAYTAGLTPQRRSEILAKATVKEAIAEQAGAERVGVEVVQERAAAILDRIGDQLNGRTLRVLGYALRKVMKTLYTHIHTNPEGYEIMRRAIKGIGSVRSGPRAVVLIPSHRSYMDFLLASYCMFMWGFPVPHICAGEDFLRLAGVNHLLRGSGAFFMRRSFKGDRLYTAIFKEYVRALVEDGRCIEFFIEGTRSRSGKTMQPKLGVLKIVVDAFFDSVREGSGLADVIIVPISMSYDKILEGSVYLRELHGHKKPPETLGNLLSSATVLRSKFGTLNVTINQPISLADFTLRCHKGEPPPEGPQPLPTLPHTPDALRDPRRNTAALPPASAKLSPSGKDPVVEAVSGWSPDQHRTMLNHLAWRVTYDLQQGLIVSPCALFAATILYLHHPGELLNGINQGVVSGEVVWVRELVLRAGGHMVPSLVAQSGEQLTSYAVSVLRPHVCLTRLNVLYMPDGDSLMLLNIYANQLVHLFADSGVVGLAATVASEQERAASGRGGTEPEQDGRSEQSVVRVPAQQVWDRAGFLCDLLRNEFPDWMPSSPIPEAEWRRRAVLKSISAGVLAPSADASELCLCAGATETTLSVSVIQPLVEAYWLVATALLTVRQLGGKSREPDLVERIGGAVPKLLEQDHLQFRTTGDREVMRNALSRCKEMGLAASAGPQTLTVPDSCVSRLRSLSVQLNEYRWRPHTDIAAAIAAVASAVAGPAAMAAAPGAKL